LSTIEDHPTVEFASDDQCESSLACYLYRGVLEGRVLQKKNTLKKKKKAKPNYE